MNNLFQDLRFAWRGLRRSSAFTALAVTTLALGIGANSTVFSWVNSTLLNPIPGLTHTAGLVSLTRAGAAFQDLPFSYPDYVDLRRSNKSFSGIAASWLIPISLTGTGKPERIWGTLASANYFDVLDIPPIRGRAFLPEEEGESGTAPVAVISYSLWQTHFGGEDSAVGRKIYINQHPYTVVGIAPALFQGSQTGLRSDLWIPLVMEEQIMVDRDALHQRNNTWLFLLGRLRAGVSERQANSEVRLLMQHIGEEYPDSHKDSKRSPTVVALSQSPYGGNRYFIIVLPALMGVSVSVLLLACSNVANLLVVRAMARQRDVAIRLSLGVSRWQLVRLSLMESILLGLAGGAAAMWLTTWTSGTLTKLLPPSNLPFALNVRVDHTVILVTLGISLLVCAILGTLPALRSLQLVPADVLKRESGRISGGFHKARIVRGSVVTQIALSTLLLVCAGLVLRSFSKAQRFDPGFDREHVLLGSFDLFPTGYGPNDTFEFDRELLAKIRVLPGVQAVTLSNWVPLGPMASFREINPEGYVSARQESMVIGAAIVGPDYLRTMRIPLMAGREFQLSDTSQSELVIVVNEALADRYWPHQDALGKRLQVERKKWYKVIGVAHNSSYRELDEAPVPFMYLSVLQNYFPQQTIHARVAGDPERFAVELNGTVHELNPDLPLFDISTLKLRVQFANVTRRIAGTFVAILGLLALVLAAIGIYGVVSFSTRQRTLEIGIRLALGAPRTDIIRMVLTQGVKLALIGLGIGVAVSLSLTHMLSGLLFGITPNDLATFISVIVFLLVIALGACYIPAVYASRLDPMRILREQ